ncbi:MAG: methyltransferase [Nitrospiraceae bacterium]
MENLVAPEIEAYAEMHSWAESKVCRALREETDRTMESPQMVVGPLAGAFLKMMTVLVQAKCVLEVGTFTGYSAFCFAEALPADGRIITCDIDPEATALAKKYFARSPHGSKIDLRLGPALEVLRTLSGRFDLIFIDADKVTHLHYYHRALELVAPNGVILIDNVLWSGDVLQPEPRDRSPAVIRESNRVIASDPRVKAVLVTIRDGIFVVKPNAV